MKIKPLILLSDHKDLTENVVDTAGNKGYFIFFGENHITHKGEDYNVGAFYRDYSKLNVDTFFPFEDRLAFEYRRNDRQGNIFVPYLCRAEGDYDTASKFVRSLLDSGIQNFLSVRDDSIYVHDDLGNADLCSIVEESELNQTDRNMISFFRKSQEKDPFIAYNIMQNEYAKGLDSSIKKHLGK